MRLTTTTEVKGGLDGCDREGEVFSSQKSKVKSCLTQVT